MIGTAGFPREARLLTRAQFQRVFREGRRGGAFGLTVLVARAADGTRPRMGVAISRRYGNAVRRNRARRLLREAFRRVAPSLEAPWDVVAMPQAGRFPDQAGEVERVLRRALRRAIEAPDARRSSAP